MRRRTLVLLPLFALGAAGIGAGALVPSSSVAAPPTSGLDASISLAVDGVAVATFNGCTGIGSQTTPPTSQTGGTFGTIQPIQVTCEPTGLLQYLWSWHQAVVSGDPTARRTAELHVSGSTGGVLQTYVLENAYPTALDDTAKVGSQSTETVTFTADAILFQPGSSTS